MKCEKLPTIHNGEINIHAATNTIGQVVATLYPPDNMLAKIEQVLLLPDGTQRRFRLVELRPAVGVAIEQFWSETQDCRAVQGQEV
jgi:hypothetical protein